MGHLLCIGNASVIVGISLRLQVTVYGEDKRIAADATKTIFIRYTAGVIRDYIESGMVRVNNEPCKCQ